MQATVRAWGFRCARIDPQALAAALRATLTDLPFLAGRYATAAWSCAAARLCTHACCLLQCIAFHPALQPTLTPASPLPSR